MKQKILSFICLLLTTISLSASATTFNVGGINYDIISEEEQTVQVGDNSGFSGEAVIPESVEYGGKQYSVTSIGEGAFYDCSGLTSVTIPSSVTFIGNNAFCGCRGLTSVTIPNSVTSISNHAFCGCRDLTSVTIPISVTFIGDSAFFGCSGLTSVTIPNSVTSIGAGAFSECSGLTSVTIPNSVTSISDYAFARCFGLTSVTIPNSVTSIGEGAFLNCSGLTSVNIPNSVTSIGEGAFQNCSGLTSVNIPNSVTTIGNYAFSGCSGLTSVTIPSSVTAIGGFAFYGCNGLATVKVSINDKSAFVNNQVANLIRNAISKPLVLINESGEEIKNFVIPNDITDIGDYTFYNCSGLTSLTIPNSVTSIGDYTFYNCSGLTSLTIPNSVTTIGNCAFSGCSGLTSVKVSIIENAAFLNNNMACQMQNAFGLDKKPIVLIDESGEEIKEFIIPDDITTIGDYAFYNCSGLTSVTIPNSVTSISDYAFARCFGLTSVTIPNSVTTIGNYAFSGCSGLTSVNIPNSVTSIGLGAFSGCSGLTSVNIPNSVTTIGSSAFSGCSGLTSVTIPAGVTTIKYGTFSNCSGLTTVNIPASVTSIGYWAFSDCSCLNSVNIPASVTSIGGYAFYHCIGLTTVNNGNNVETIGKYAFSGCSGLTSVTIPNSVTSIDENAFEGCSGLTSVTIGNGVTTIGNYAFFGCSGLTTVTIGNSVTSIGKSAFRGCSGLTDLTIPASVTTISAYAFWGCSGLTSVKVSIIDNRTFLNNYVANRIRAAIGKPIVLVDESSEEIKGFIIPSDITEVGDYAFYNCSGLTSVTIPACVTAIQESAFNKCSPHFFIVYRAEPASLGYRVFSSYDSKLYVPKGSKTSYESTEQWKDFKTIIEFPNFDVNQDKTVDVVDVVGIVRYVVMGTPYDFVYQLADYDENDEVNVVDAVMLINEIAGDTNWARTAYSDSEAEGELILAKNGSSSLSLMLDSHLSFTAFQFDLTLPENANVMQVKLEGQLSNSHSLVYSKTDQGFYRVVAFSTSGENLDTDDGILLNIELDGFVTNDISIDNIHFVTPQCLDVRYDAVGVTSIPTGIHSLSDIEHPTSIYNLNGQRMTKPGKGVNIINGKKLIVK